MTGNRRPGGGNNGNGWNGRRHKRGPRRFNHKMQAKLVVLFIAVLLASAATNLSPVVFVVVAGVLGVFIRLLHLDGKSRKEAAK